MMRRFVRPRRKRVDVVLIDRDGVINKDPAGWTQHSYVTEWKHFHFLPGVFEALRILNKNNIKVVLISNQAGVGKGHFTKSRLDEITSRMLDEINKNGGSVDDVYYCIHKKEDNCACRKPKPGMLEAAMRKHGIDKNKTFFIGDSERDIIAGYSLGIRTVFVKSGKHSLEDTYKWDVKPDYIFKDLLEAVVWIVGREKRKTERALKRKEGVVKGVVDQDAGAGSGDVAGQEIDEAGEE